MFLILRNPQDKTKNNFTNYYDRKNKFSLIIEIPKTVNDQQV